MPVGTRTPATSRLRKGDVYAEATPWLLVFVNRNLSNLVGGQESCLVKVSTIPLSLGFTPTDIKTGRTPGASRLIRSGNETPSSGSGHLWLTTVTVSLGEGLSLKVMGRWK